MSRSKAAAAGLAYYFTGKPCVRGHIAPRTVKRNYCVECKNEGTKRSWPAYKEANKERIAAQRAERRTGPDGDKMRAQSARWKKANPERNRLLENRRRARKAGAGGSHTVEEVLALLEAQSGLCAAPWCRADLSGGYEVDHILPIARGGSDDLENIQLLCSACNRSKHKRTMAEWAAQRG